MKRIIIIVILGISTWADASTNLLFYRGAVMVDSNAAIKAPDVEMFKRTNDIASATNVAAQVVRINNVTSGAARANTLWTNSTLLSGSTATGFWTNQSGMAVVIPYYTGYGIITNTDLSPSNHPWGWTLPTGQSVDIADGSVTITRSDPYADDIVFVYSNSIPAGYYNLTVKLTNCSAVDVWNLWLYAGGSPAVQLAEDIDPSTYSNNWYVSWSSSAQLSLVASFSQTSDPFIVGLDYCSMQVLTTNAAFRADANGVSGSTGTFQKVVTPLLELNGETNTIRTGAGTSITFDDSGDPTMRFNATYTDFGGTLMTDGRLIAQFCTNCDATTFTPRFLGDSLMDIGSQVTYRAYTTTTNGWKLP